MTTTGDPEIGDQLAALVQEWGATGRPSVGDWTMDWRGTHRDTDLAGLLLPDRWRPRLQSSIADGAVSLPQP
ncbi:MAG: hypothetical protein ACRDR6_19495 [Pseudonocardiaceae bacterium]